MILGIVASSAPTGESEGITHGSQLTVDDVGYTALGVTTGQLYTPSTPGEGFYRVDDTQWGNWPATGFATGTYSYNNDSSNHGGWVPTGGLTIDGYFYPAGTY